jgi:hypothetical protein
VYNVVERGSTSHTTADDAFAPLSTATPPLLPLLPPPPDESPHAVVSDTTRSSTAAACMRHGA